MTKNTPKILIISETFKTSSGGGITLSNLFKDYPINCLANAVEGQCISQIESNEICNNYYSLGHEEKKVIWLFSFLQKKYTSGKFDFVNKDNKQASNSSKIKKLRPLLVEYFFSILHFLGIYHLLYKYKISPSFEKWVKDFNPDYIYTQLSSRESIILANQLLEITNASLAIHMMDDWPSTISKIGILQNYWQNKIDFEFRSLIKKAFILMSISDGMSNEYKIRYNADFTPFHNPIETEKWAKYTKNDFSVKSEFKILYTGRIGTANGNAIMDIANAVRNLQIKGHKIKLMILSPDYLSRKAKKMISDFNTDIKPPIPHILIPKTLSSFDLLVLPLDFDKKGINFAKLSMPTKASEYMISGTPILIYADKRMALSQYAIKEGWAHVVSTNKDKLLEEGIIHLYNNAVLRKSLSLKAQECAKKYEDVRIIRPKFQKCFI